MATDLERLVVQLSADIKGYENALNKASSATNKQARSIENRFNKMNKGLAAGFTTLGNNIVKAFAVLGGIRGFQSLIDSTTRIDNALKVAGLSGEELDKVYSRLRDSAMKNAAPLEAMVTLYGRASLVQKELGVSQEELIQFTDRVGMALRASGQSAEAARGALLQLGQALSTGVVRAEEYNSLQEGATTILRAVAAGLKEAGGSVGSLTNLVKSGQVSSEAFFRAFEAGAPVLERMVSNATLTTSQGLENVQTAMIDAAREFAKGSLAAESLGDAFGMMAAKINSINFEACGAQVRQLLGFIEQVRQAVGYLQSLSINIGAATGLDAVGEALTGGAVQQEYLGGALTVTSHRALQNRIDAAFGTAVETASDLTEDAIRRSAGAVTDETTKTGRLPASTATPVSLSDFAAPSSSSGGKGKGSGGGRDSAAEAAEREAEAVGELISDLEYEKSLIGSTDLQREVSNALRRAGAAATEEQKAQITSLVTELYNEAEAAENLVSVMEGLKSATKDIASGFISDLRDGVDAAEALSNALDSIADKLIDAALDSAIDSLFGGLTGGLSGSGGGIFGALFGKGFADGGYTGSGGKNQPAGVVHAGEYVFSKKAVDRLGSGNLEAMHRAAKGYANGGLVTPAALSTQLGPIGGRGSTETIKVELYDDSGRMATIADQRIQTASGSIVQVSVQQSRKAVKGDMPGLMANAQARSM